VFPCQVTRRVFLLCMLTAVNCEQTRRGETNLLLGRSSTLGETRASNSIRNSGMGNMGQLAPRSSRLVDPRSAASRLAASRPTRRVQSISQARPLQYGITKERAWCIAEPYRPISNMLARPPRLSLRALPTSPHASRRSFRAPRLRSSRRDLWSVCCPAVLRPPSPRPRTNHNRKTPRRPE
jgi:hypothetical protein